VVKNSDFLFWRLLVQIQTDDFIFFLFSGINVIYCYFVTLSLIQYVFVVCNKFSGFILNIVFVMYRNDVNTVARWRHF